MTDNPLEQMIEQAGRHARRILVDRQEKQLLAAYELVGDADPVLIGCPWKNDIQKQVILAKVREKARDIRAIRFSLVAEAWMRIEDGSKRQEIVVAIARDKSDTICRFWRIIRDRPG